MSLQKILDEIGERLPDGVTYRVGGLETIARVDGPSRIVMAIGPETWEAPHGQGGDGARFPRRLATRASTVTAHVWHKTMDDVEQLLETLANILQELCPGSHRRGAGQWIGDSVSDRGIAYTFEVTFLIQVTRREVHTQSEGGFLNAPDLVVDTTS